MSPEGRGAFGDSSCVQPTLVRHTRGFEGATQLAPLRQEPTHSRQGHPGAQHEAGKLRRDARTGTRPPGSSPQGQHLPAAQPVTSDPQCPCLQRGVTVTESAPCGAMLSSLLTQGPCKVISWWRCNHSAWNAMSCPLHAATSVTLNPQLILVKLATAAWNSLLSRKTHLSVP